MERGLTAPQGAVSAPRRHTTGFTLIELMIVVAVVAILAAVAYPSYSNYVMRSNRAAAQSYMLELSNLQQRYLLDARVYADALDKLTGTVSVPATVDANYTLAVARKTDTTLPGFTLTATPKNGQVRDTGCAVLTIDETGRKTASGGGSSCW